jgi:hypothetical protein
MRFASLEHDTFGQQTQGSGAILSLARSMLINSIMRLSWALSSGSSGSPE